MMVTPFRRGPAAGKRPLHGIHASRVEPVRAPRRGPCQSVTSLSTASRMAMASGEAAWRAGQAPTVGGLPVMPVHTSATPFAACDDRPARARRAAETERLVAGANAEWAVLTSVLAAFTNTCVRGLYLDYRQDDGEGVASGVDDGEVLAIAHEVVESLADKWKANVLDIVRARVLSGDNSRSPWRETATSASTSMARHTRVVGDGRYGFLARVAAGDVADDGDVEDEDEDSRAWQSATADVDTELTPAARDLYANNYQFVLRLATSARRRNNLPESVDDELEAVALKALARAARTYNPEDSRGASFNTFLYAQVTPDLAKASRKLRQHRGVTVDDGEVEDLPDVGRVVDAAVEDDSLRRLLEREIRRLPPRQAEIVELHTGMNDQPRLSLRQISERMGMHEVSVRRLFGLGLNGLRQALAGQGVEEFMSSLFVFDRAGRDSGPSLTRRVA